ncbi:MAG: GNAT family N-acetyltransferase [Acidobacteriota bacterium]|nr:GNAT family N-acetyltransferase [Acidobacteriota bacterium]
MTNKVTLAESDEEILNCFSVLADLRPHVAPEEFLPRCTRQREISNYRLAYLFDGEVKAVAGFRIAEWLASGKFMEIEDFASKDGERSKGYGGALFDWLVEYAREENCRQIKLVSRVTRFDAHRFYLRKRMNIEAHYFTLDLQN